MSVRTKLSRAVRRTGTVMAAAIGTVATATAAAAVGVSPPSVEQAADPGEVINLTKTVSTPQIPPKPDIVLLVDRTGSMGPAINDVKANVADIVADVTAVQPEAQFAVAQYCDFGDPAGPFQVVQNLTADAATVTAAVNSIVLCGGGDEPEAQLNALWEIGSGAISFRPDSTRIVAWFGDAPGHDPSGGHTEGDAVAALQSVDARVVAVSVGANRLDLTGQATRITQETDGVFLSGVGSDDVSAAILEGLSNLPVTVGHGVVCDDGVSAALSPTTQTVTSGDDVTFDETITVAADAPQGSTVGCTVTFTLNGMAGGPEFVQTISIDVNDVTPPEVSCPAGPNPAGDEPQAHNQDGFFRMLATDNVDPSMQVSVTDLASGVTFGPYASGTTFKLTQAPGAPVRARPFVGAVDWKFTFKGDAMLTATDAAGNTATVVCLVPPPPA